MFTITEDELDTIVNALDSDDADVRRDYSGRGMYGRVCLGLVIDDATDFHLGVAFANALGVDRAFEAARVARTDSMGRSTIVYFPGVTVEDYEV